MGKLALLVYLWYSKLMKTEKEKLQMAEYRKRPEIILRHRIYMRGYVARRGEEYRKEKNEYLRRHHLETRDKKLARGRELYWKARVNLLGIFGGKCKRCGFSDIRALQIDHIRGGGTKERKSGGRNGKNLYYKLMKEISLVPEDTLKKYQLLCANCNYIKRV